MSTTSDEPIVERDPTYERMFFGQSWLARCPRCRQIISRYDFSEDDARDYGQAALVRDHRCDR